MRTIPNVSLAREASRPEIYFVVGDTKFSLDPTEIERLAFDSSRVRTVDDGTLERFTQRPLHAPPAVRASDVHFDCGTDFDAIDGRWHFDCQPSSSLIRHDILVAGWLIPGSPRDGVPYVNMCLPGETRGVEDVHFNVLLDDVFADRVYGRDGLSTALRYASCPGNPMAQTALPFPDVPSTPERGPQVRFNSWFLPTSEDTMHGELNAWHEHDSGRFWGRHFVGRGAPPDQWLNPVLRNEAVNPDLEDSNCWFPFDVFDPEQTGRPLVEGDYVVMRGALWQDSAHGEDKEAPESPWDAEATTTGQGGWLEIHPVDWVVRVAAPSTLARVSGRSLAVCTEVDGASSQDAAPAVTPRFAPSRTTASLQVRSVTALVDDRFTRAETVVENSFQPNVDHVATSVKVQARDGHQGRFKGSWLVEWREVDRYDRPWPGCDDGLPPGAVEFGNGEGWDWRAEHPLPFSGRLAHHSPPLPGMHQHYFQTTGLSPRVLDAMDQLFTHVYLDPDHPPEQVMVQWLGSDDWEHRAFWGTDLIPWGILGTVSRLPMGPLPFTGEWVRLEVPAAKVGLVGKQVRGLAFSLYAGAAAWDYAGVRSPVNPENNAAPVAQTVPSVMVGGQAYPVSVVMRNTGASDWSRAEGYALGSQDPTDNTTWGVKRVLGADTPRGATCEFRFTVTAPRVSGFYGFQWRMVQEPEWFGVASGATAIEVTAPVGRSTVPDLREMYRDQAIEEIVAAGLVARRTGDDDVNAYVVSQTPKAGTDVNAGSTVTIQLRHGPIP